MNILSINIQGLGHKTKKEWLKALTSTHRLNVIAIQETKMASISHMDVKFIWANSNFEYVCIDSLGNSGGILCIWEATIFKKDYVTISDNFVAIYGTWLPSNSKILFVTIYAPHQASSKKILWEYVSSLVGRWNGDSIIMGDFNEVRSSDERRGSCFNPFNARRFDRFITFSALVSLTVVCLDRHLSDHRPILIREVILDFGPIPFRFYNSWFNFVDFDDMVESTWRSFTHSDRNKMIGFKKKLQDLKCVMRDWIKGKKASLASSKKHSFGIRRY